MGSMLKRVITENQTKLLIRAKQLRNNPTEPEKRLWRYLSGAQMGGFKFRRQTVIDNSIVDFYYPMMGLIVEVDGDTHDRSVDLARDERFLRAFGFRTCRVMNSDVMNNIDGVLQVILMFCEGDDAKRTHPNPSLEREGLT